MTRSSIASMKKELRYAENLAYLWSKWSSNDYRVASQLMQDHPEGWDGHQSVSIEDKSSDTSVFAAWLETAQSRFQHHNGYRPTTEEEKTQKIVLLQEIENDIAWWKTHQEPPNPDNKALEVLLKNHTRNTATALGGDDLHAWANTWLNTGWLTDASLLKHFARKALESSDFDTLQRLVKQHGVDVNDEYWTQTDSQDSQWGFGNGSYRKHQKNTNMRRLGFFIRDAATAKTLTDLGFDWDGKDSSGQSTLAVLQSRGNDHFRSVDDRSEVMKFLNGLMSKRKNDNPQEVVWGLLSKARKQEDVTIAVSGVKWQDLRDANGANLMHALACYAPTSLKKFAASKGGLALMSEKDNVGRTPLEYALGFGDSEVVGKSLEGWAELRTRNKLEKADWLEVKWIAVENDVPNSVVQVPASQRTYKPLVAASEWKQASHKDFKDALASPRGQAFLTMAAQHYGAKLKESTRRWRNTRDNRLYLDEWVGPPGELSFIKSATTLVEVQVALWECWNNLAALRSRMANTESATLVAQTKRLTQQAIEMDIDVAQMKRDVLTDKRVLDGLSGRGFDDEMKKRLDGWGSLEAMVERQKLSKRVAPQLKSTTPKFDGAL
jgi:hypothetical protein